MPLSHLHLSLGISHIQTDENVETRTDKQVDPTTFKFGLYSLHDCFLYELEDVARRKDQIQDAIYRVGI